MRVLAWCAFLIALAPLVHRDGLHHQQRRQDHQLELPDPLDGWGRRRPTRAAAPTTPSSARSSRSRITSVLSVPLGLAAAVYLTEYGQGWLPRAIRFFVDVMTGVPSIVAGLFIYVFWVLGLHQGFSGFAGALALVILMLPVIIRSAEEMLLLVPKALREAAYALGVPQWKTIVKIVLPTASAGLVTGIMLAVARVIGETAPLLLTVFGTNYINMNPFKGAQEGLPQFIYNQALQAYQPAIDRAWAGALTLIVIVVILYTAARLLTRRNQLAGRR